MRDRARRRKGGRKGGREEGRKGGREEGRKGGRERFQRRDKEGEGGVTHSPLGFPLPSLNFFYVGWKRPRSFSCWNRA
jgi:hypothetical protein